MTLKYTTVSLPDIPAMEAEPFITAIRELHIPQEGQILLIIDDITRPGDFVARTVLEFVVGLVGAERTSVVIASGMHRANSYSETRARLGPLIRGLRLYTHNPFCKSSPFLSPGDEYYRIGVGTVMPHTHVDFSGGMKLCMPGLAHIESVERFHQMSGNSGQLALKTLTDGGWLDQLVNSVVNKNGDPIGVWAGTPSIVYEKAIKFAEESFSVKLDHLHADVVILEPTFKTMDFQQSMNGMRLLSKSPGILKDNGMVCLISDAHDGVGTHYLFQQPNGMSPVVYDGLPSWPAKGIDFTVASRNLTKRMISDYFNRQFNICYSYESFLRTVKMGWDRDYPPKIIKYVGSDVMIGVK